MNDEIGLSDYWRIIRRRIRMIFVLFAVSVASAIVAGLLLPKYYRSQSMIITSGPDTGGLGAALSGLPFGGVLAGAAGIQAPADKVMVFLKSRRVAESVIRKCDLLRVFNESRWDASTGTWKDPSRPPFMEDAVTRLTRSVARFTRSKEGSITVTVEWKDPALAADMANQYVSALMSVLNEKAVNVTIQVVDRAVPAERKSKPKVALNAALAGVMSLAAGVFFAFSLEYLQRSRALRSRRKDPS